MIKPVYVRNMEIGAGIPRICVPLTGKNEEELFGQAAKAVEADADLVEWRVDYWEEEHPLYRVEEMLFALRKVLKEVPLLLTFRSAEEGGEKAITPAEQTALIRRAADSGQLDMADVEYLRSPEEYAPLIRDMEERGVRIIASSHDFEKTGTKEELRDRLLSLSSSGADIIKLAVMPACPEDVARLMDTVSEMTKEEITCPVIAMSMGELGAESRVEGEKFGSSVTFGTVDASSAPGQLPIHVLREKLEALHARI